MHICSYSNEGAISLLVSMTWILTTVWEVLALCLSVWIAAKHFRDMRRLGPSTGSTIGDCFRVLIQSHVLYFAR
jgi:preprotein translocase subunit SecG